MEFVETGLEHHAAAGEADLRSSKYDKLYRRINGVHAGVLAAVRAKKLRRGDPPIFVRMEHMSPRPETNPNGPCDVIPDFKWPDVGNDRIRVTVTHVLPTMKFWVHLESARKIVADVSARLNEPQVVQRFEPIATEDIRCGVCVIAPRQDAASREYQR